VVVVVITHSSLCQFLMIGPESLPLKPGEWNHVKLSIAGQIASLELNGGLVYQRKLERTNQRTFGLFHYADRSELLVRNPVMRCDWPKTLPAAHEQELLVLNEVERNRAKLAKVFHHDFGEDGLPEEYFSHSKMLTEFTALDFSGGEAVSMSPDSSWPRRCSRRAISQQAVAHTVPAVQPASTSVGQWTPRYTRLTPTAMVSEAPKAMK
jgi:hypothetical protein